MQRILLSFILLIIGGNAWAQINVKIEAPSVVTVGQSFRIDYTIYNGEGEGFSEPQNFPGLKVTYLVNTFTGTKMDINGNVSYQNYRNYYRYTVKAEKEGTFTIPAATVRVKGKTYTFNSTSIKVLPADSRGAGSTDLNKPTDKMDQVDASNSFVRAIVSKTKIYEQEAFLVTFKVYSIYLMKQVGASEFPEFEGFITEDIPIPSYLMMGKERYNGRNYYVADFKKFLLFPQRSGKITIPSGKVQIVVEVRSGRTVQTPFGSDNLTMPVSTLVTTSPVTIDVSPLPEDKPLDFANAVGTFSVQSNISSRNVTANDNVTLTVNISGNGNLKLIRTPDIKFPSEFETYDPKLTTDAQPSGNGLAGTQKIEYLFIPRQEGKFEIPATEFSYFDPGSGKYKQLQIPAYTINVAKDPTGGNTSATSYNQDGAKIIKDIRHIKTGEYKYVKSDKFLIGSLQYILWYIIPSLLLIGFVLYYRKRIRENADIVRMKTKRANKVAIKRLKLANTYLQANNNEKFYEEILRAVWGYLSDKLTIPVANLNRENIELELGKYGASNKLVESFISILDTCEYARYAPAEPHNVRDNFYNKTVEAITEMENTIKEKKTDTPSQTI